MAVQIGEIIKELVHSNGLKAKFVAGYLSISESNLYDIYKRSSIDVDKLIKFSELFNTNLFIHYINKEPIKSMFGDQVFSLQEKISELENEITSKNEKIIDLTDLVQSQKKIIAFHESAAKENSVGNKKKTKAL